MDETVKATGGQKALMKILPKSKIRNLADFYNIKNQKCPKKLFPSSSVRVPICALSRNRIISVIGYKLCLIFENCCSHVLALLWTINSITVTQTSLETDGFDIEFIFERACFKHVHFVVPRIVSNLIETPIFLKSIATCSASLKNARRSWVFRKAFPAKRSKDHYVSKWKLERNSFFLLPACSVIQYNTSGSPESGNTFDGWLLVIHLKLQEGLVHSWFSLDTRSKQLCQSFELITRIYLSQLEPIMNTLLS